MVQVSLSFPTVEAALAGLVNPEDIRAASVAGSLPTLKFRSVAIYGLSHCFACTSETYSCQMVRAAAPTDIFDTRCDTQFANDYVAVPL